MEKSLTVSQQNIVMNKIEFRLQKYGAQLYSTLEIKRLRDDVDEFRISGHQFEARIFIHLGTGGVFCILGGYKKSGSPSKKMQDKEIDKAVSALHELRKQPDYVSF